MLSSIGGARAYSSRKRARLYGRQWRERCGRVPLRDRFQQECKNPPCQLHEASLITCLVNDYGYEHRLAKALELHASDGDLIILISSSGKSLNMVRAADYAKDRGLIVVTFTGFGIDNPLKGRGKLNFWADSRAYNIVEMTHHIWLLAVCDLIIGKAEYPVS
ncbi:MAG: SIS domain-containing protein [Desulfomonile tiedjei]|nr:SIS domain-containing protein [Desulfomonile tiedjei]